MKKIFIVIAVMSLFCSCTFLIIDKAEIGMASEVFVDNAEKINAVTVEVKSTPTIKNKE